MQFFNIKHNKKLFRLMFCLSRTFKRMIFCGFAEAIDMFFVCQRYCSYIMVPICRKEFILPVFIITTSAIML